MASNKTVISSYELVEAGVELYKKLNGKDIEWNDMCDLVDDYDDTNKDYDSDMVYDIVDCYGKEHFKSILFEHMFETYGDFYLTGK